MPYEEEENIEVSEPTEEEPSTDEVEGPKEYTPDEMLEYLLNEVTSIDEAKSLLSEHGFELKKIGSDEEFLDEAEEMPMPMPMSPRPRINIVELRLGAAKKAIGKGKKKEKEA